MKNFELPKFDCGKAEDRICEFIRHEAKSRGVVLGFSGGVDSATIAALSARALGRDRVLALIMPEASSTPSSDTRDAIEFAEELGIDYRRIDITLPTKTIFEAVGGCGDRVCEGNVKARLRMTLLYFHANLEGRIVVGSGDRSELMIGYFTKYGDGGVDILPIGGLYKTQVRELARHLGIPERITGKKSSPRLWPDHVAEDELGVNYEEVDMILRLRIDLGHGSARIVEELGPASRPKVEKILKMIEINAHKLKMPPIAKVY
jgi:NAD+ synthase